MKSKAFEIIADMSKDEDVSKIVERALRKLKKIDVLINCAGILKFGGLQHEDIVETFDRVISVNLKATLAMTKQALPALIESKGCIINISSVASSYVTRNPLVYNISKAGVTNFTKFVALELATHGVRVNCISPGPVNTDIWEKAGMAKDDVRINMVERLPLKQYVKAEEIAELAVYLASDNTASITGSDFVVDAGMLLGKSADLSEVSTMNLN
ncbi:uncharacterized oxidoreductase YxbG-like [Epargyreus clarus]|uniref:uncharacterized oxidoreductase YxbG-like n=1 Tax=Epargyreus clarus TaxID=520877 RepID=UPI003C2D52ED